MTVEPMRNSRGPRPLEWEAGMGVPVKSQEAAMYRAVQTRLDRMDRMINSLVSHSRRLTFGLCFRFIPAPPPYSPGP